MSHFGVLSYKGTGHLNPLIALSRQLVARGHRVTFFQRPELEDRVRQHGLEFVAIGKSGSSRDESGQEVRRHKSTGIAALRQGICRVAGEMEMFLREAPAALAAACVDTLIMDEITLSGPTLAEMLGLPYFVVSTSVPHNFGWDAPRGAVLPRSYFDRVQDALLQVSVLHMRGPVRRRLDKYRRQAGLGPIRRIGKAFPELAHITQLPRCLDFPRATLPDNFYYTGPFVDEAARTPVEFPWDRLDGQPVVYVSLGTARKSRPLILRLICEACEGLELQLVISLGGRHDPGAFEGLPGEPLVVREVPQLKLLKRSAIVVTHGGLNTALEALMEGKPMIVLPIAYDQPAVAARLVWVGVAEMFSVKTVSASQIRAAVTKMLNDPRYSDAAREMQMKIRSTHGLERAVEVIEGALMVHADGSRSSSKNLG